MLRFLCFVFLSHINGYVFGHSHGDEFVLKAGINSLILMPTEKALVTVNDGFMVNNTVPWFSQRSQYIYEVIAPRTPGFYTLRVTHQQAESSILQVIVKTPIDTSETASLNNFQINKYPPAYKELIQYSPPKGLIEISQKEEALYLSDSVQIKNILCKQPSSYPKYLLVTTEGLNMLTRLRDYINSQGIIFKRFSFISGYRTPFYNMTIGNGTHSRHQYGDAFDLFIDVDNDNKMDDITGDGKQDKSDVDYLYRLFVAFLEYDGRHGGVGKYYPTSRHGGFVHIDNRGFTARW
jgi:uncharacterized protein YcbK (DUF882 family)